MLFYNGVNFVYERTCTINYLDSLAVKFIKGFFRFTVRPDEKCIAAFKSCIVYAVDGFRGRGGTALSGFRGASRPAAAASEGLLSGEAGARRNKNRCFFL